MNNRHLYILIAGFFAILTWSGINPHDYPTWALEVAPAVIGLIILSATYKRFRFTPLVYILVFIHSIILMVGGHYTYAEVPLFNYIRDAFDLGRNHYDRVGHFAQGFIPAIIAREMLMRKTPLKSGGWLFFIVTSICLAMSAFYEFIEWWVALISEEAATAFLGTQGDVWDTQWDMFLAMSGAMLSQIILGRAHNKEIERMKRV